MPRFSGVKCEECQSQKIDSDAVDAGYRDEWVEIQVIPHPSQRGRATGIYLGKCDPGNCSTLETHYLCSPPHLFQHIARLLNIDPTELHREKP